MRLCVVGTVRQREDVCTYYVRERERNREREREREREEA